MQNQESLNDILDRVFAEFRKECDDANACREKSKDSTVNRESVIITDDDDNR